MAVSHEQAKAALSAVLKILRDGTAADNYAVLIHSCLVLVAYAVGLFSQPSPTADDQTNVIFGTSCAGCDELEPLCREALEFFEPDNGAVYAGVVVDALIARVISLILERLAENFLSTDIFDELAVTLEELFGTDIEEEDV